MPQMVWSSSPSGATDYFNRRWCDYTGAPAFASSGDAWMQSLHPDDASTASPDLQQRVLALGRAHEFVRPQGDRARGGRGRDDRQPIGHPARAIFHDLATNAAEYGALATTLGVVEITITGGEAIKLTWRETGGPPVPQNPQPGFGQSLIEMSVTRQLGGALAYDWRPEGLRVTARIPVHTMAP